MDSGEKLAFFEKEKENVLDYISRLSKYKNSEVDDEKILNNVKKREESIKENVFLKNYPYEIAKIHYIRSLMCEKECIKELSEFDQKLKKNDKDKIVELNLSIKSKLKELDAKSKFRNFEEIL